MEVRLAYRKASAALLVPLLILVWNLAFQVTVHLPRSFAKLEGTLSASEEQLRMLLWPGALTLAKHINSTVPPGDNILDLNSNHPGVLGIEVLPRHVYYYKTAFDKEHVNDDFYHSRKPVSPQSLDKQWLKEHNIKWILHNYDPLSKDVSKVSLEHIP